MPSAPSKEAGSTLAIKFPSTGVLLANRSIEPPSAINPMTKFAFIPNFPINLPVIKIMKIVIRTVIGSKLTPPAKAENFSTCCI
ncbi:hypothetical protein D3C87_2064410 [compost metagenome]